MPSFSPTCWHCLMRNLRTCLAVVCSERAQKSWANWSWVCRLVVADTSFWCCASWRYLSAICTWVTNTLLLSPVRTTSLNSFRTATRFFWLCQVSLQDQHQNFAVRLMQSKFPFQRWRLVCFHCERVFLTVYNSLLYSLHIHKIWKISVDEYKSYGTLSKTTHFLTVFCGAGMVQKCREAQTGMVQDGLTPFNLCLTTS